MTRVRQIAASLVWVSALGGCELVAKFDRDRINAELPDVGVLFTGDGAVLGGDSDSAVRDAGLFDGATSAPDEDAGDLDGGDDAASDAGELDTSDADAGDGPLDASDAQLDASDAQLDAVVPDDANVTDSAVGSDAAG